MNRESQLKLPRHGIIWSIISVACLAYFPVFLWNFLDILGFPFVGWLLEVMGDQSIQLFVKDLYNSYQISIDASIVALCVFFSVRYFAYSSWQEFLHTLKINEFNSALRPALFTTGFTIVATAMVISLALLMKTNASLFFSLPLDEIIPALTLNVIIFQLADSTQLSIWYFGGFYRYFRKVVPWYVALIPGAYFTIFSVLKENFSFIGLIQYYIPIVAAAWLFEKTGKLGTVVLFLSIWAWLKFIVVAAVYKIFI